MFMGWAYGVIMKILLIIFALAFPFCNCLGKAYTDADRKEACSELNAEIPVEYAKMGLTPEVLSLRISYDAKTDSMLLSYSGTMVKAATVEDLRNSWVTRLKSDGLSDFRGMGFKYFFFYANGKNCSYRL